MFNSSVTVNPESTIMITRPDQGNASESLERVQELGTRSQAYINTMGNKKQFIWTNVKRTKFK